MINEEAFEKFILSDDWQEIRLHAQNSDELAEKVWQAAIAYMQEQSKLIEHCCPECGCHFVGEFPFNYKVKQNKSTEQSESTIQVLSIQENKIIPNATFIGVCEHGYSPPAVGTKLYTTPQRQQPLKRLSEGEVQDAFNKAGGFGEVPLWAKELINAIMDAMQEINK